jgi:flagellar biosynthesis anti-sigma factor FlgM
MKIEPNGTSRLNPAETEATRAAEKASRANESANVGGLSSKDQATLSDRAKVLAKAYAALEDVPEVRSAQVEPLKEQVQNGTYSVPQEEVVKRLLAQVRLE